MGLLDGRPWRRRLRWLAGRGWSVEDFAERYARGGDDAWGYRDAPQHRRRAEWIVDALPAPRFEMALEAGCAQGFLSERLAPHVGRLIACDLSAEAVRQARENCRRLDHIEFHVADIRAGLPGEGFDLCLFSDVLYYLSARENDAVLDDAARKTAPCGVLAIVSVWDKRARGLTPPSYAFAKLDDDPRWTRIRALQTPFGEADLSMRLYLRRPLESA
jgi:predicted TPR repeat methyltransferase